MKIYHRTSREVALRILSKGFRDGTGNYLTLHVYHGVWFSNVSLDENEGAHGDTLLEVRIPAKRIADFEWVEEGKPYREWLIPAKLVNTLGSVRLVREGLW